MTWLSTTPYEQADPASRQVYDRLRALYPAEYAADVPAVTRDGKSDSVVAAHSLIPEAMWHMMAGLAAMMRPDLPLTRRQQEMIATVVSAENACFYWTESHAEFLRRASLDEGLAAALRRNHHEADIDARDRAMLDFAVAMTRAPWEMTAADTQRLRDAGFDDRAILQITLIAAYFNYINRVADALGVGRG